MAYFGLYFPLLGYWYGCVGWASHIGSLLEKHVFDYWIMWNPFHFNDVVSSFKFISSAFDEGNAYCDT